MNETRTTRGMQPFNPAPLTELDWYAFRSEQRSVALSFTDLHQMVEIDVLRKDDWIWRPGWEQWIIARDVPGLFPVPRTSQEPTVAAQQPNTMPAGGANHTKGAGKQTLKSRAWDETKTFFLMFIYLAVIFGMFTLYKSVVLEQQGLDFKFHGFAIINAFVMAKVMLVAEGLRLGRRFEAVAPYVSILIKAVLFALTFLCFHILEHVAVGIWNGKAAWDSVPQFGAGGLKGDAIIAFVLALALLPYFAFKELERLTGERGIGALAWTKATRGRQLAEISSPDRLAGRTSARPREHVEPLPPDTAQENQPEGGRCGRADKVRQGTLAHRYRLLKNQSELGSRPGGALRH